jgi:hypothetical protein
LVPTEAFVGRKGISAALAGLLDNIQGSMDGVDTGMNRWRT